MRTFAGKTLLITGASEGIGKALALELAAEGANLVLLARNAARLEASVRECRARGAQAEAVAGDVTRREDCERSVARALQRFGGLDALVNNAGVTMWARFDAVHDFSVYERLLAINYLGAVHMTAAALPHLKAARGLIVAIASMAGLTGVPERTGYAASKHAMVGFFESLRIELAGSGVDVCVVAPDFVVTETHKRAMGPDGQPLGESPMQQTKIMTAADCAARIIRGIEKRERLVLMTARGRLGRWLKLVAPSMIDRIAAKAIRDRK